MAGGVAAIGAGFALLLIAGASTRLAALVAAVALALLAALAATGWARARGRAVRAVAAAEHANEERRTERERMDRHIRRVEGTQRHETELLRRMRRSIQAEREWNRELRAQIHRLHEGRGMLDEPEDDLHALVLRAAIELVEAEKGLLISRSDEDADGELDVVVSSGFEHDPQHSAVAQRFARAVLARDEIIREDDPPQPGPTEATPADAEIEALVAIPVYMRDRFHGVIVCANRPGGFEEIGDELLLALGDHAGSVLNHGRLQHELENARRAPVRVLAEAVSAQDPVLHRETCELAVHAGVLAQELGLDQRARDVLVCAALLRAVGHLALPERPRLHPGPLSPDDRALIELHPRLGFDILTQAPALQEVAQAVLYHHERFDGTGYPAGLAGADIPLPARVLAVLEAYGAMTHERPYRTPMSSEEACRGLVECGGTQFDPEVVAVFVEQIRRTESGRARITRADVSAAILDGLPLDPGAAEAGGSLLAPTVDEPTLLGNHRALRQDLEAAARHGRPFGVVVLELSDLPRINSEDGLSAGDRLIEQSARSARRAAARLGGTAYRLSGRRLAIVAPERSMRPLDEVTAEFLSGPRIRATMASWSPEEPGEAVLDRARDALRDGAA